MSADVSNFYITFFSSFFFVSRLDCGSYLRIVWGRRLTRCNREYFAGESPLIRPSSFILTCLIGSARSIICILCEMFAYFSRRFRFPTERVFQNNPEALSIVASTYGTEISLSLSPAHLSLSFSLFEINHIPFTAFLAAEGDFNLIKGTKVLNPIRATHYRGAYVDGVSRARVNKRSSREIYGSRHFH